MTDLSRVNGTDSFKNMVEKVNDTIDRVNGIGVSLNELTSGINNSVGDIKKEIENINNSFDDLEKEIENITETTNEEMNAYLAELYPEETATDS